MANDQKPVISVRKLRKVYMMGQELSLIHI